LKKKKKGRREWREHGQPRLLLYASLFFRSWGKKREERGKGGEGKTSGSRYEIFCI